VVHGVHLGDDELARIAACGATVVTCPRSNGWVGAGEPPVARFFASGVAMAVGTDSLASAPDLNLFSELAALHRMAPGVAPRRLIDAATRGGAVALQLEDRLGTIAPGKDARLLSVSLPDGAGDPEAALVEGVSPERVRWVGGPHAGSVH
jgi:aminodeoxyfutalosine deaminase